MKWIEIIEIRTADSNREQLKSQIQELINESDKEIKKLKIKVYSRVMLDTDFSIHLFHNSKEIESSGSQLGLRLSSAFKEFGLVNHCIWAEMHGK